MENENIFFVGKVAVTGLVTAFAAAFGWLGILGAAWVGCMAADYISGSAVACKAGEWSSAKARSGLWHKGGMILVVAVAGMADGVLGAALPNLPILGGTVEYSGLLLPMTICWYILTELGSILENANALGAPLPGFLIKALAVAKDKIDDLGDDQETADKE